MGGDSVSGKSIDLVARDVADGFVFVNPIFLKRFDQDLIKKLMAAMNKMMILVRNEKFPAGDFDAIKTRNLKLSRLNNSITVIKNFARERRWVL